MAIAAGAALIQLNADAEWGRPRPGEAALGFLNQLSRNRPGRRPAVFIGQERMAMEVPGVPAVVFMYVTLLAGALAIYIGYHA